MVLPDTVLRTLGPALEHAINGAEIWWIVKALEVWGKRLQSSRILVYGDNQSAISGYIRGYTAPPFVASLVGAVHDMLIKRDICSWFEYVHSESNPLDPASRVAGESGLASLGVKVIQVQPNLETDLSIYHPGG